MPKHQAMTAQVGGGISGFAAAAELATTFAFEDTSNGLVVREPVGVVGCITPWNYPLNQIGAKVAYALAAGCTVVLKPSEVAPVNAFILAEIIDEIGFPAGVFNLVSGARAGRRRSACRTPRRRHGVVHRFHARRQAGRRAGGALGEEGRARARRQVTVRHPRRRRLPQCGGYGRRRGLRELGADVRRAHADARAEIAARRGGADRPRRRRVVHRRRSVRRQYAARSADLVGPARSGARLHRGRHRRRRDARHRWSRARPTASRPATS